MRPSHLIILAGTLGAALIGLSVGLTHFDRKLPPTQSFTSPSAPIPSPSVTLSPTQMTVEDFMNRYFEALNRHDFNTAYAFLSPAWGVEFKEFQQYWSKFEAGSIKSRILTITQSSSQSAIVTLRWSGRRDGKTVKLRFQCSLRATPSSYRIEQCK